METTNNQDLTLIVKTFGGLEEVLANELRELGAKNIQVLKRAIQCEGDKALMYKANYWCRTALRVLVPISTFKIEKEMDFYKAITKIQWEKYMHLTGTLAIDAVVSSSVFTHSKFVALRAKDAIVDRFMRREGRRPSISRDNPDLRINIHMYRNNVTLSLDSSGSSLHKRGYREANGEAPLSEVLAAGMIMLSGWDKQCDFVDFMCGSGTILIEAAMIANNFAPGMYRPEFGFQRWLDFDVDLWDDIVDQSYEVQTEYEGRIVGSDISSENLQTATRNIKSARLHKDIELIQGDLEDQKKISTKGMLISNPPYGERIKPADIKGLYRKIGNTLKHNYTGWDAWIISSHIDALNQLGLRPEQQLELFNGPLECRYLHFDIYEGSKEVLTK